MARRWWFRCLSGCPLVFTRGYDMGKNMRVAALYRATQLMEDRRKERKIDEIDYMLWMEGKSEALVRPSLIYRWWSHIKSTWIFLMNVFFFYSNIVAPAIWWKKSYLLGATSFIKFQSIVNIFLSYIFTCSHHFHPDTPTVTIKLEVTMYYISLL